MKKLHFSDIVNDSNLYYHAFTRVTKSKSNNNIAHFIYVLDKKLTQDQIQQYLNIYNNIAFGKAYYKYDQNINYNTLIIYDKKIK